MVGPKGFFIFASSSFPEHSTLGDAKSSISVRVRLGFGSGSARVQLWFLLHYVLLSVFTVYSIIILKETGVPQQQQGGQMERHTGTLGSRTRSSDTHY